MPRKSSQGAPKRTARTTSPSSATTKRTATATKRTATATKRTATATKRTATKTGATAAKKATARKKVAATAKSVKKSPAKTPAPPLGTGELAEQLRLLAETEHRIQQALESIEKRIQQIPTQIAGAPEGKEAAAGEMDEVTASFRRALSEALDRKLEELMAPVVSLHHRLKEEAGALEEDPRSCEPDALAEALNDAVSKLQKVLRGLGGGFITPEVGEFYDPLIHLAVGEAPAPGGVDGAVAEVLQPGYKSGRGRVVVPARVIVGRR